MTPYLAHTDDNPDGPLGAEQAEEMRRGLTEDRDGFFGQFITAFVTADGKLMVTEEQRQNAIALCRQSDQRAALECMEAFGTTDLRADLTRVTVPSLVPHGSGDLIVPFEGSGKLTHAAIPHSRLAVVDGGPHGLDVSHREEFSRHLVDFLAATPAGT